MHMHMHGCEIDSNKIDSNKIDSNSLSLSHIEKERERETL